MALVALPAVAQEERSYFLIEIPCREGFKGTLNVVGEINDAINDAINENAQSVLLVISKYPLIKRKSLLGSINISKATLERIIKQLSSEPLNLIEYKGSLKTGGYVLTEKGDAFVKSVNNDYYG